MVGPYIILNIMNIIACGIAVKITFYHSSCNSEVVYYRYNLPMRIVEKWKWYFEYLAARIKYNHPRNKVELVIVAQSDCLCGEDYKNWKIPNLIKAKERQINKLKNDTSTDLFDFQSKEREYKIEQLESDIKDLNEGKLSYVPPTYINHIKNYI